MEYGANVLHAIATMAILAFGVAALKKLNSEVMLVHRIG